MLEPKPWLQLSPQKRLSSIRGSSRCAGCHRQTALVPCGLRLEETLADILQEEIPKGQFRLCEPCKTKLLHAHDVFKRLLLVKNKESRDRTAVRFMNMKTLKPNWLCRVCGKITVTIVGHRKSCIPQNSNPNQRAQAGGAETSDSQANVTRNKLILGKRKANTDRNAKRVKFDLERNNKYGEKPPQVNQDQNRVQHNSASVSGLQHNNASVSGLQHNNAGGSGLQHNNTSASGLQHDNASVNGLQNDNSDESDFENGSVERRRQYSMVAESGLQHNNASVSGLQHNKAGGSRLQHNNAAGSGLQHNNTSVSGLQHNNASGSGLQHNNSDGSDFESDSEDRRRQYNLVGGSGLKHNNSRGSGLQHNNGINHDQEIQTDHNHNKTDVNQRQSGAVNLHQNDDNALQPNVAVGSQVNENDITAAIVKNEGIPTQVEMVETSVIVISDDEDDPPHNQAATPKKQSTMDRFLVVQTSAGRSELADNDITSTSAEEVTPARAEPLERLVPRPFICEMCTNCFNSAKGLRNHKATIGAQCPICKDSFCTQRQLADHKRSMHARGGRASLDHEGPVQCRCCHKEFRSHRDYDRHYTYMGRRCHGAPQGLMDSQCPCQTVRQPVRRRHSVHPTDYRSGEPVFRARTPTPRRHSVCEPVHIKVEPDLNIHEQETPPLNEVADNVWTAQEIEKHSEELPNLAPGCLLGVEVEGEMGAGGGAQEAEAAGLGLQIRDVREMRDTHSQRRAGSCDSSQPADRESPRAQSVFNRGPRASGEQSGRRMSSLAQAYRRLTVDRSDHTSDSVNTTTPDDLLNTVSMVRCMYTKLMDMCEKLEPIVRDVEAVDAERLKE